MKKRIFSKEARLKMSLNHANVSGQNNPMYGKKHSEETKQKIKLKRINRKHGGYRWSEEAKERLSRRLRERGLRKKEKNPQWKGYNILTDLDTAIRYLIEYKEWRIKILKRDNYACQNCNHLGRPLEVHHKKEFKILLNEFLQIYNQFSPIEDKETLLRLATSYEPFWDMKNGQTLCKKCHNKTKYLNQFVLQESSCQKMEEI